MRALIQRVTQASVSINGEVISSISEGMLIYLGVHQDDTQQDLDYLIKKISQLRIFSDAEGKMNKSITDCGGSFMLVSQFTLHARTKKGNRPSFIDAADNELARKYYNQAKKELAKTAPTKSGKFGTYMMVDSINDGPVTIIFDTKNNPT